MLMSYGGESDGSGNDVPPSVERIGTMIVWPTGPVLLVTYMSSDLPAAGLCSITAKPPSPQQLRCFQSMAPDHSTPALSCNPPITCEVNGDEAIDWNSMVPRPPVGAVPLADFHDRPSLSDN